MKLVSQEFRDAIDSAYHMNVDPRVRAEWNWNATSYLSEPARNGVKMWIINNEGLYKPYAGSLGESEVKDFDQDFFRKCFDVRLNNELNNIPKYLEVDGQIITDEKGKPIENPRFSAAYFGPFLHKSPSWQSDMNPPPIGALKKHFSIVQEFHMDIKEEGWHVYKIEADDRFEVFLIDDNDGQMKLAAADYESGDFGHKPEVRNGYIARYYAYPGKYFVKVCVQNVDLGYAFRMSKNTPRMRRERRIPDVLEMPTVDEMRGMEFDLLLSGDVLYPDDDGPVTNPTVVGLDRILEKGSYFDEEDDEIKFARSDINVFDPFRKYFPAESIVKDARPESGIHYSWTDDGENMGMVMPDDIYVAEPLTPKKSRYYALSTENQIYQYWMSDCMSSDKPVVLKDADALGYPIPLADIIVYYDRPLPTNKIKVTFNVHDNEVGMPHSYKIMYSPDQEGDVWFEAGDQDSAPVNPYTGMIEIWRQDTGEWSDNPYFDTDTSHNVRRLRLVVMTMREPLRRVALIELSARRHIDVTSMTTSFSLDQSMDSQDQFRVIGTASSNSGQVNLSNLDGTFDFDHLESMRRARTAGLDGRETPNAVLAEKRTKFTFDIIYTLPSGRKEPIRVGTMYGSDWSSETDLSYSFKLFDAAKNLQNIDAPSIMFTDKPIHIVLAQILDYIGYTEYSVDLSDYRKQQLPDGEYNIETPVLPFFVSSPEQSVWEVIQKLCEATYSAVYIDEYGTLQLITRDELTRPLQTDSDNRQAIEPVSHWILGQEHNGRLSNALTIQKGGSSEANSVKIKFNPQSIKENGDPYNPQQLTDILWEPEGSIVLQAARIIEKLEKDEKWFYQVDPVSADLWQYEGKANINGEIVAWRGKEYQWMEYIYEDYVSVIAKVTNVPTLIRPEFEFLSRFIQNTAATANNIVDGIPDALGFFGIKIDLSGLKNFFENIIEVNRESGQAKLHYLREVTEISWVTRKATDRAFVDRVLIDKKLRKEIIYSEEDRVKRNELTGRYNAIERTQNTFTGKVQLVPDDGKENRGRGVDDSRFVTSHGVTPKSGWHPKMLRGNLRIEDGYFKGEEQGLFFPVLDAKNREGNAQRGGQTAICGIRDVNRDKWGVQALVRQSDSTVKSLGARIRFLDDTTEFNEFSLLFGFSKKDAFGPIIGPDQSVNKIEEANQWVALTVKSTSEKYSRSYTNEIDAEIFTANHGRRWGDLFNNSQLPGARGFQMANQRREEEADNSVRHRGYPYPIEIGKWYDIQVNMKRAQDDRRTMFNVYMNGQEIGGFTFLGPDKDPLPLSRFWGIGVHQGTMVEIDYAWAHTDYDPVDEDHDYLSFDPSRANYTSSIIDQGKFADRKPKASDGMHSLPDTAKDDPRVKDVKLNLMHKLFGFRKPISNPAPITMQDGRFFFDDFGSMLHEIREFDLELDKGPGVGMTAYISNPYVKMFDLSFTPHGVKFSLVNTGTVDAIAAGQEVIGQGKTINNAMVVYGYKIMKQKGKTVLRENKAAIKDRGEVKEEIDADWITTDEQAIDLANWIVRHFSDSKDSVEAKIFPDASYSIGDRAKVIFDDGNLDPNALYIVNGYNIAYNPKGLSFDVSLRKVRNNEVEYYDIEDERYGIKYDKTNLADERDTGALSAGGELGLTRAPIDLPNTDGEFVQNTATDEVNWQTRNPVAGFLVNTALDFAFSIVGTVAANAISQGIGAAMLGTPLAPLAPIVTTIATGIFTTVIGEVTTVVKDGI